MNIQGKGFLLSSILLLYTSAAIAETEVGLFGMYEGSFKTADKYGNPYTEVEATASITCPDGGKWSIPLFWDGGDIWKVRISPGLEGDWSYTIRSNDKGLDGKTGEFKCIKSNLRGSIEPMKNYGHSFQYQDGEPFVFWGDTAWGLFLDKADEKLDRQAVFHYIDKRAGEGINVMHSMLLSEAGWGNSGGDPFSDISKEKINPGYWREVDVRLEYLNSKGIIGGLVLAWGNKGRGEKWAWREFPSLDSRKRYARYIAARYGVYDTFFIVSGEWHAEIRTRKNVTEDEIRREFFEIGDVFAKSKPHERMMAIHPMTSQGSVREFNEAGWMSFGDYQQNYADLHGRILESRKFDKPIVNSEYGYYLRDSNGDGKPDKDNSFNAEDMRFATWDIVMAGGWPVTGYGTTYMGGNRDPGPFNPDDKRNEIWAMQYGIAKEFLAGIDFWTYKPADDLITYDTPRSGDGRRRIDLGNNQSRTIKRPPERVYWLMTDGRENYIVYVRGIKGYLRINLTGDSEGAYSFSMLNPRTGERSVIHKKIMLTDSQMFMPPDMNDWVFHLKKINE